MARAGRSIAFTPSGAVTLVVDEKKLPGLKTPNGLANDGTSYLLLADFGTGILHRIKLADGTSEKVAEGFDGADGLTWDHYGRLYITSWKTGKVFVIPRPGEKPVLVVEGFKSAADCCLDPSGKSILVPDMKAGTLTAIPAQVPGAEVDETPLPLKTAVAFPDLKWTGWSPETSAGRPSALRPIVLTHAGDGSNRVFVATQHGVIHVFPNDQKADRDQGLPRHPGPRAVRRQAQRGRLPRPGLPPEVQGERRVLRLLHPETPVAARRDAERGLRASGSARTTRRSRPGHRGGDLRVPEPPVLEPRRRHASASGRTATCTSPTATAALGNDPYENGQNLGTPLGKILRIDVEHEGRTARTTPSRRTTRSSAAKDALPEIWAYGLRNLWRMAFDRKTGKLWAATSARTSTRRSTSS